MAGPDRRRQWTFERDGVLADRSQGLLGNELPAGLNRLGADDLPLPLYGRFGSFKDLDYGIGDLWTDPIARNERNYVCFHFLILE